MPDYSSADVLAAAQSFIDTRRGMLRLRRERDSIVCEHGWENQCRGYYKARPGISREELATFCAACQRWYAVMVRAEKARVDKDTALRRLDRVIA